MTRQLSVRDQVKVYFHDIQSNSNPQFWSYFALQYLYSLPRSYIGIVFYRQNFILVTILYFTCSLGILNFLRYIQAID
ncbi:unnamed protein product [Paramecium octaurelia]|uniref:Uncharacterized protein n=1 Tax=Paramecium octaurelia TaxID=43137 RepID=A0A8S1YLV5_PAROT|nr:unnamed protein product [Paramecium octaurelia]